MGAARSSEAWRPERVQQRDPAATPPGFDWEGPMGTLGSWRAALDEYRADRIRERTQAGEDIEVVRARQRALETAQIQRVRPGLELRLEPTDWLEMISPTVDRRPHLVVSTVHEPILYRETVGWVRVWGHTPRCGGQPDHGPCITLMCRVGAILDAMDRQ
ncbi:hypothetical protein ACN28C_14120 [Plantactinospora sp. WMMC1484]|uniref:hypothetical protein n=1 Tax=Plantactinospora sp. WMMC1484 TaxID=3404122 RepID=UPI003BF4D10D